ncbi:MAG TPA: porin family protein [Ohtaekwangia sp.]|uniref:porin family protein n=1 Tax=Ohtaekwangia sp. TaxID=2066019 RepID=UPI002F93C442
MKKILLAIGILSGFYSYAQIPLGFKAGVNVNTIGIRHKQNEALGFDSYTSFHVGVFTKLKFSNKFTFIPELQFIEKGAGGGVKLGYIEAPLVLSYQPIALLNIEAGPSIGVNVSNNTILDYNKTDFGAIGGLRFNLTPKWSLLGRYYYGISNLDKVYFNAGPNGVAQGWTALYNRNFQFSVAYYLRK